MYKTELDPTNNTLSIVLTSEISGEKGVRRPYS